MPDFHSERVETFIRHHSTDAGRRLANRLHLKGKGSTKLADLLSAFAWNMRAAKTYHDVKSWKGLPTEPNHYLSACLMLRQEAQNHPLFPSLNPVHLPW